MGISNERYKIFSVQVSLSNIFINILFINLFQKIKTAFEKIQELTGELVNWRSS